MKYKFPYITHINDVLPAIEGRDEFIVAEREHYTVINYMVAMTDTFPEVRRKVGDTWEENCDHTIRRECRGLLFYPDGRIMSRRLHKFFNINERDETQFYDVDFTQPHVILEKLDGSMITPVVTPDGIRWGTKMGLTDVAMGAEEFVAAHPRYSDFAQLCIEQFGYTPIFEWCSRKQRIVVDYPEDRLVLIAVRETQTGVYRSLLWMQQYAKMFDLDVVKAYEGTAKSMAYLMDETKGAEGIEGWVIRFDDGHMLKLKGEWYIRIHKSKDILSQEKSVIDLIVNEQMDDAKAFMMEEDRKRVEEFERQFWYQIDFTIQTITHTLNTTLKNQTRKEFALTSNSMLSTHRAIIFSCWDGNKNVCDELLKVIKNNIGTQTRVDEIRHLFGELKWNYDC